MLFYSISRSQKRIPAGGINPRSPGFTNQELSLAASNTERGVLSTHHPRIRIGVYEQFGSSAKYDSVVA